MERENLNYKKEYDPAELLACPYNVPVRKKCRTCSGYPALGYCAMFPVLATVPECDKGPMDNLKGNTLSCGSGRHATRKSPLNMLKQRVFLQIPVWIRNKVVNSSYGKRRKNSPVTFTEEQKKRFWCIQCSVVDWRF